MNLPALQITHADILAAFGECKLALQARENQLQHLINQYETLHSEFEAYKAEHTEKDSTATNGKPEKIAKP